nr:MAG TPA: hypothetical protein [Caudoviricetes sp.]
MVDAFLPQPAIKRRHSNRVRSPFECRLILFQKETLRFGKRPQN